MRRSTSLAALPALAGFLLSAGWAAHPKPAAAAFQGDPAGPPVLELAGDSMGLTADSVRPTPFAFPSRDRELQAELRRVLAEPPFARLSRRGDLSVSLVDLSRPDRIRYAGVHDNRMRYAASLPKIGIMLGVFDAIERGNVAYTAGVRDKLERMIRRSENGVSTELIELVGFDAIKAVLEDPRYELYDLKRNGGLWVGRDYGGGIGLWRRDPMHQISHGATARQVARFLVMMDRGELVSPWASSEMKRIMGHPEIEHKFVLGLKKRPSRIFRKSGTWQNWHADAAIIERGDAKYVAVALMESSAKGVMSQLILRLDDIITGGALRPVNTAHVP